MCHVLYQIMMTKQKRVSDIYPSVLKLFRMKESLRGELFKHCM